MDIRMKGELFPFPGDIGFTDLCKLCDALVAHSPFLSLFQILFRKAVFLYRLVKETLFIERVEEETVKARDTADFIKAFFSFFAYYGISGKKT